MSASNRASLQSALRVISDIVVVDVGIVVVMLMLALHASIGFRVPGHAKSVSYTHNGFCGSEWLRASHL
jgi:hypothetical protein